MQQKMDKRGPMPRGGKRAGAGRPAFEPNDLQRKQVRKFKAYGMSDEAVCSMIADPRISVETLKKYFRSELELAVELSNMQVVESLHLQAVGAETLYDKSGKVLREEIKRNVTACIWWTKARMGWRDSSRVEVTGKDGEPLLDVSKLTDAELDALEAIVRKATAAQHADDNRQREGEAVH